MHAHRYFHTVVLKEGNELHIIIYIKNKTSPMYRTEIKYITHAFGFFTHICLAEHWMVPVVVILNNNNCDAAFHRINKYRLM